MTVLVRPERAADRPAVREIIRSAFPTVAGRVMEVGLDDELRGDPDLVPALTLVAERDGVLVGQLTSSYGTVTDVAGAMVDRLVGVGPVAVRPADQRTGVGRVLLTSLIDAARGSGERALVLLGDPAFYGRFGFRPALEVGLQAPDPAWGRHFQVLPLVAAVPRGRFAYAAPFGRL